MKFPLKLSILFLTCIFSVTTAESKPSIEVKTGEVKTSLGHTIHIPNNLKELTKSKVSELQSAQNSFEFFRGTNIEKAFANNNDDIVLVIFSLNWNSSEKLSEKSFKASLPNKKSFSETDHHKTFNPLKNPKTKSLVDTKNAKFKSLLYNYELAKVAFEFEYPIVSDAEMILSLDDNSPMWKQMEYNKKEIAEFRCYLKTMVDQVKKTQNIQQINQYTAKHCKLDISYVKSMTEQSGLDSFKGSLYLDRKFVLSNSKGLSIIYLGADKKFSKELDEAWKIIVKDL